MKRLLFLLILAFATISLQAQNGRKRLAKPILNKSLDEVSDTYSLLYFRSMNLI